MTDQTIPPDQARRARQWARDTLDDVENGANVSANAREAARTLITMMPRPTLADMTAEERAACQWMLCDVKEHEDPVVILNPYWEDGTARIMWRDGGQAVVRTSAVTPRPDLPRMEWPANESSEKLARDDDAPNAVAPSLPAGWRLADHKDYGRVIVTTQTPDRDGYVYVVIPDAGNFRGYDWHFCDPDRLTYLDQGADQ